MLGLVSLPYVTGILSPAVCQRPVHLKKQEGGGTLEITTGMFNFADQVEVIWVIINAKGVT